MLSRGFWSGSKKKGITQALLTIDTLAVLFNPLSTSSASAIDLFKPLFLSRDFFANSKHVLCFMVPSVSPLALPFYLKNSPCLFLRSQSRDCIYIRTNGPKASLLGGGWGWRHGEPDSAAHVEWEFCHLSPVKVKSARWGLVLKYVSWIPEG